LSWLAGVVVLEMVVLQLKQEQLVAAGLVV
jgi:hypothetical protein